MEFPNKKLIERLMSVTEESRSFKAVERRSIFNQKEAEKKMTEEIEAGY